MGTIWGLLPAAGCGSRIQPLAFSKELLPVGSYGTGSLERPRAISEYVIDRMVISGVSKICFIISPSKSDIIRYYGCGTGDVFYCYTVQQQPTGLCSALFCATPLIDPDDFVITCLPDTVWFPENALCMLRHNHFSFVLFPVNHPEYYDSVELDDLGYIKKIHVKENIASDLWIWGAFGLPGKTFQKLYQLWVHRDRKDEYIGTLVNAFIEQGNSVYGVKSGLSYVDVGTLNGYREAMSVLYEINTPKNSFTFTQI
jgi:dTDP-glucose pyrophosphorylase